MRRLHAIDLCCGAGGWAVAARGLPIAFLAVVDWADDCLETWRLNHGAHHPALRANCDLALDGAVDRVLALVDGQRVDIVLGGIPCEEISQARYTRGAAAHASPEAMDRWYALLENCLTINRRLEPRWWCFEDIINIERLLPRPLFHGRHIPFRRIDASHFGPQKRIRTFIGEFPEPQPDPRDAGPRTLGDCLRPGPHLTISHPEQYRVVRLGGGGNRVNNDAIRLLDPIDPCPTVVGEVQRGSRRRRQWMIPGPGGVPRIMDWREQATAQGFPEDFIFACGMQRASKLIAQAIPIQVGQAILQAMCAEAPAGEAIREGPR